MTETAGHHLFQKVLPECNPPPASSVDEPAGDAIGAVANNFAGLRLEDIHTVTFTRCLPSFSTMRSMSGLAEDDEEVAFARVLEVFGHV
jgi:hypothetical protein